MMRPLYDGQENHYKKMLELQEKLRKSEEERIRLEEKFNLLVQESRNRHQSCINQLRIRYVEFLEEQRARDERNNKLLGTLDKVDSSLALMTAKTERLNILRKQYEAYLLRAYGTQRANGSVTADSGLESQNDREITPSPVFPKTVALIRKNPYSYGSPELPPAAIRKTPELEMPNPYKSSTIQKPSDVERDLNYKFAQAAAVPSFYDDAKDILKTRLYIPSYLMDPPKYTSTPVHPPKYTSSPIPEPPKIEIGLRNFSIRPTPAAKSTPVAKSAPLATSTPGKYDLDRYLGKIKQQLQVDAREQDEPPEPERSIEDADQEQNTSGDLLNVTLSDDGIAAVRSSPEADALSIKDSRNRFRELMQKRQAYAAENATRNRSIDRSRVSPISKLRRANAEESPSIDKFRQPEIVAPQREIGRPFVLPPPLSVDDAFAKLALLSEPRRPTPQRQSPPLVEDVVKEDPEELREREAKLLAEADEDDSEQESKKEDEDEGNGDGIEDDYDESVDIDSWMPDDAEQQVEEPREQDDIRELPRRKLESIEEVEPVEDEEDLVNKTKPEEEQIVSDVVPVAEATEDREADQVVSLENAEDVVQENKEEEQTSVPNEAYDANDQYTNQQYYQQDDGSQQQQQQQQQQYEENAEYAQNYDQQQGEEQHYQYSDDPNQQYAYDANGQYAGYDGQQYTEEQYQEYMNQQYQQYDPNQAYEHDPNQEYQHYEGYQTGQTTDGTDQTQYDPNQASGYPQDQQAYGESYSQDVNQAYDYATEQQAYAEAYASEAPEQVGDQQEPGGNEQPALDQSTDHQLEESVVSPAKDVSRDKPKDDKKKKDVIKSILDSDSESFIERNLSNTESDFDFN